MSNQVLTQTLDLKGLKCPLPVLRAQKVLRGMSAGEEIIVLATDPASTIDMPHFCNTSGNELVSATRDGETFIYTIRKCEASST